MYKAKIGLSAAQKKKLASGGALRVMPHKIGKKGEIVVNKDMAEAIMGAKHSGSPVDIILKPEEIKMNVEGGFLPGLAMMLAPALAPAVGQLAQGVVGKLFGSGVSSNQMNVNLTAAQLRNIRTGKPFQLTPSQIKAGGKHIIALHPANHKKIMRALKQNKGVRIQLSASEIEGGNLMDFLRGVGRVGKKAFETVAPILKPILAPLVRQGLTAAATAGTQKLGEKNKFLGDIASTVAPQLIDAAATKAGFGMKGKRSTDKLQDDRSVFLNPDHPANSPVVPYISGNRGGRGFKPSGY